MNSTFLLWMVPAFVPLAIYSQRAVLSAGVQQLWLVQHTLLAQGQAHRAAAVQRMRPVLRQERQAPSKRALSSCILESNTLSLSVHAIGWCCWLCIAH